MPDTTPAPEQELTTMDPAEQEAMQAEINAILKKYNAEIGVRSEIKVWKLIPKGSVASPLKSEDLKANDNGNT